MLSITPTKLADYLSCPHKYKLRHVEKLNNSSASPALAFGNSIHQALQEIHRTDDPSASLSAPERLLKRFWDPAAYLTEEENELYFNRGCRALKDYCAALGGSKEQIIDTEVFMSFIVERGDLRMRLGCKADRLSIDESGELEVLDYKTNGSGKVPTGEFLQEDLPTFLYYVLARITFPQYTKVKITFLNVLTMGRVSIRYTPEQIVKNKHGLWQQLRTLHHSSLSPRTSEACSWCQYQDNCPAFNKVIDFAAIN